MTKQEKKRLDDLFRDYIRKRAMSRVHGCERCGAWKKSYKDLQCAHWHTRRTYSLRWHELNALGLCGGCHMYLDSHPHEKDAFWKEKIGEDEFERLYILAHMTSKQSPIDSKLKELELRELLKEFEIDHNCIGYVEDF